MSDTVGREMSRVSDTVERVGAVCRTLWRGRGAVCRTHTPSTAFRHLPPKEGCRKPVLGVCVGHCGVPCVEHCGEGGSRVLELASAVTHNGGTFRTTDPKGCRSGDEVWGQILGRRWGPLIVGGDEETGWQWRLISYMVSLSSLTRPTSLLSPWPRVVLFPRSTGTAAVTSALCCVGSAAVNQ